MTKTKRRRFGAVKRITRGGRDWLEGSYPTPLDAFATWPDLPKRQYKMVAPEYAAELDAWLADAEKRIAFNLWTPPQVERAERERDEITFADYARRWADTHRRADGELVRGSARSKHLEIIELYLIPRSATGACATSPRVTCNIGGTRSARSAVTRTGRNVASRRTRRSTRS